MSTYLSWGQILEATTIILSVLIIVKKLKHLSMRELGDWLLSGFISPWDWLVRSTKVRLLVFVMIMVATLVFAVALLGMSFIGR